MKQDNFEIRKKSLQVFQAFFKCIIMAYQYVFFQFINACTFINSHFVFILNPLFWIWPHTCEGVCYVNARGASAIYLLHFCGFFSNLVTMFKTNCHNALLVPNLFTTRAKIRHWALVVPRVDTLTLNAQINNSYYG